LNLGFAQVNVAGGIGGRQIELLVRDDAGIPERAVANTQALLARGVLAMTGYHGSASIEATLSLWDGAGVPVIGVASGAEILRDPLRPLVFNLRAGVREEAAATVLHLDTLGVTDIAVLAQDDAIGAAGLQGMLDELMRLAMRPTVQARLPREAADADVTQAVLTVCKNKPQAMVLVLDPRHTLAVVQKARQLGCKPQFYVLSGAGVHLMTSPQQKMDMADVAVSQVLPHPAGVSVPIASDYQRLLAQAGGGTPTYPGLEGFMYARVITEAIRRCTRELVRSCLVAALEARPVDVGGYRVLFSPSDRRGSRFVEMTIVTPDGRFRR
jgi:branched-chain amino acid transport system substrate-binding protein